MIEEYFLIIGSGLSGASVSEYLTKKGLPFDIADTREVPPFEIYPSKNGKTFFGDNFKKIDFHLKKTLKIPYPILLLIYYGGFVYLFVKFVHLLIIIAELFGFN